VRASLPNDVARTIAYSIVQSRLDVTYYSQACLSQPLQVTKGPEHARQSSPQKRQVRAHHSSTVRTSLAARSAAYRFQSGHSHLQSKTIRTSDLSFTTVIRLYTKPISPLCIPTSSSDATYKNASGTVRFYLCSSKNLEQSTGKSPKLLYSGNFQIKLETHLFNCTFSA